MMNIMFVLLAKRAFSEINEGVNSKHFLLTLLLAWSEPPAFYMNNAIKL